MRDPESPEEIVRVQVARAALTEMGYADQAAYVRVNATGHLSSDWFQHLYPTPERVWWNLKAWWLAYLSAPCGCEHFAHADRFGNIWRDEGEMLMTYLAGLPQWRAEYHKANA